MERYTEAFEMKSALLLIESFVKSPNSVETDKVDQFLHHLIQTFPDILEHFESRLKQKIILFIRHAQSQYNAWKIKNIINLLTVYENKIENYDPCLTELGNNQCKNLKRELDSYNQFQVDLVFVSPLRRAIQTFLNVQTSTIFSDAQTPIVTPLLREMMDTAGDIGSSLGDLKKQFPDLRYDFMTAEKWWTSCDLKSADRFERQVVRETRANVASRAVLLLLWVSLLDAKKICFVGHGNFYKVLNQSLQLIGSRLSNAEAKIMDNQTMIDLVKQYFSQ